jgi:hypothetical protein
MTSDQITSRDLRLSGLMAELEAVTGQNRLSCTLDAALKLCSSCPGAGDLEARLRAQTDALAGLNVAGEIMQIAEALAHLSGKDEEIRERNWRIFATRYGVIDIGERPTLDALAKRFGMTRERVRQINAKLLSKLAGRTVWAPACNAAIASSSYIHMSAHAIDAFASFAWDVLATRIRVEKVKVRGRSIVTNPVVAEFTANANSVSQSLIARNGAAQALITYSTAARLNSDRPPPSFDEFYSSLCQTPDLVWLDKATGWYAFKHDLESSKQNRIRNHVLKMLASTKISLDVEEAFAQLGRYRDRGKADTDDNPMVSIPHLSIHSAVLKALLMHLPEVQYIGHDDFVLNRDKEVARTELLSDVEQEIYAVLANNGGLASRSQVRKALVETGKVGHAAFTVTWERSPILSAVERGICRLIGWNINAPALEEARCTVNG